MIESVQGSNLNPESLQNLKSSINSLGRGLFGTHLYLWYRWSCQSSDYDRFVNNLYVSLRLRLTTDLIDQASSSWRCVPTETKPAYQISVLTSTSTVINLPVIVRFSTIRTTPLLLWTKSELFSLVFYKIQQRDDWSINWELSFPIVHFCMIWSWNCCIHRNVCVCVCVILKILRNVMKQFHTSPLKRRMQRIQRVKKFSTLV